MVVSKGSTPLQALGYYIPFITSFINNMRKIEREMIQAIIDRRDWRKANTEVEIYPSHAEITLHGNEIGRYYFHPSEDDPSLEISHAHWKTNTTKSRLNALISFVAGGLSGIYQKNFNWYYKRVDAGSGQESVEEFNSLWLAV